MAYRRWSVSDHCAFVGVGNIADVQYMENETQVIGEYRRGNYFFLLFSFSHRPFLHDITEAILWTWIASLL